MIKRRRALPTRAGALPNLIVIGAQKCGTSVLHYYLSLHPEVSMSKPKELNFFIEERNWPRGVDWYTAHFDAEARVRGEASPNYTAFPQHQGVPERMASVVPDAKLIYMVRDPLERIAAHWVHNYAKRREKGDLAETLTHPNTSYVTRASTPCSSSASWPTTRSEQSSSSSSPSSATSGWRRCAGSSSSSASTRTSTTRASSTSAIRPRARPGPRGSPCGSRSWAAAAAGGCCPPTSGSCSTTACRCAARSSAPTCAPRCPPETLAELRDDGERLRELTGRDFSNWSIWDA